MILQNQSMAKVWKGIGIHMYSYIKGILADIEEDLVVV